MSGYRGWLASPAPHRDDPGPDAPARELLHRELLHRRKSNGDGGMEALRILKRRLSSTPTDTSSGQRKAAAAHSGRRFSLPT